MGIPDGSPKATDLVDTIISASSKLVEVKEKDGTITMQMQLDADTLWWKTLTVSSNTFGRFAFELKELERKALTCISNMCPERAKDLGQEIMEFCISYRRSIDAKSSESVRDSSNSQSTLIDKINKNKVEKVYTVKDGAKKSLMDGILQRDAEKDEE